MSGYKRILVISKKSNFLQPIVPFYQMDTDTRSIYKSYRFTNTNSIMYCIN